MTRLNLFALRLLFAAILFAASFSASAQVKVVDAESGLPVSYASVFDDATGKVLGITSSDGLLPSSAASCAKVSVQHINYEPVTVSVRSIADNTIRLVARAAIPVKEVTVGKEKSDYVRLKLYVRQYSMVNGTVAAVGEGLYYGYYDKKSKKRKKYLPLSQKALRNDSIFTGQRKLMASIASSTNFLPNVSFSSAIKDFAKYDDGRRHREDYGKYKLGTIFVRHDDNAKRLELVKDSFFVEKPFNFWILGVTLSDVYSGMSFSSAYGKPGLSTLQNFTFSARVTHNKTQATVDKYIEVYVLGVDYDNKSGFKSLEKKLDAQRKSGSSEKFVRPDGLPPFNKYVTEAMSHMKEAKASDE